MNFYDLKQSGVQVQELLDSISDQNETIKTIKNTIDKIPIITVDDTTTEGSYNINNLLENKIYYIPTSKLDRSKFTPTDLRITSNFVFVINLREIVSNTIYCSQCLLAKNNNYKFTSYIRTSTGGTWSDFKSLEEEMSLKIKTF